MSQSELLKKTVASLERLGEPYMLTGSFVSSLQGEPRSTHDIDLVVAIPAHKVDALLVEFPAPEYYLDRKAALEAIGRRGMFNVLHVVEGDKVDFWMLTDEAFDQSRFGRRVRVDFDGETLFVSAPEDTILMKLKWDHDSGGSERQFRDALSVYELNREILDQEYVQKWVVRLQLQDAWRQLVAAAKSLET